MNLNNFNKCYSYIMIEIGYNFLKKIWIRYKNLKTLH